MREIGTSEEPWYICRLLNFRHPLLPGSCVLSGRPPTLRGLIHLERGGMPFHGGVRITENGATTEIKAQEPIIWAKWCMLDDCACVV